MKCIKEGFIVSQEEIEQFIKYLDEETQNLCVYPDQQTLDCVDCYLCRVSFFDKVRNDLRDM